jgi:hypothetical protein
MISDTASWYEAHSYHALSITGDVTPLVILPQSKSWYSQQPPADLLADARAAALVLGFDTSQYDLDVVRYTPIPGWDFLGLAATGKKGVWLQSSSAGVLIHELGHCFGLAHANAWAGLDDSVIGPGSVIDYGNPFDTMALPQADVFLYHFNVIWKRRLNWLPVDSIRQITNSATVRLFAFDVPGLSGGNCYGIRIRKDDYRDYWLEFRQSLPDNRWSSGGILINSSGTPSGESGAYLLDTTPGTPTGNSGYDDSFLRVGSTFSDNLEGIHITPLKVGTTGTARWVDVQIHFGSFPANSAPLLVVMASRTNAAVGEELGFVATAGDADGDPLAFHWDFGDLTDGDGATAGKAWAAPGHYVVRCTVSDLKGGNASRSVLVTVDAPNTLVVRGRVYGPDGNGLSEVRVHNGLPGELYRGTRTDVDGSYILPNLPSGSHQLVATKYGYQFAAQGWSNPLSVTGNAEGIDWSATKQPAVEVYAIDDIAVEATPLAVDGRFLVQRSGPLNSSLSVQLRFSGSATFSGDYTTEFIAPQAFAITLPPGIASTNIGVKPRLDSLVESPETIDLILIERSNYVAGPPHRATVRLYDPPSGSNSPPLAGADILTRYPPNGASIDVSLLLANDSDPDGDALTIGSVATVSSLGASITRTGSVIRYIPVPGSTANDSFTYTLLDGRGLSMTGIVQVITANLPQPILTISMTNGVCVLSGGNGVPGAGYRLQSTDSVSPASWQTVAGVTNSSSGRFLFFEPPPLNPLRRFYRTVYP